MKPILEPGRNCWRIERADRVAFLVDGADYFRALRASLKQAEESILILAWDIDSRLQLVREDPADGLPAEFGAFLNALISRKRRLHGHILSWDFAMLFALDREWLPIFKLDWKTHRRLRFHMDDRHPFGGSHHQKVVVIDDRLAFAGGLDLTLGRWDTSEHRPDDPRRIELGHEPARPYHDVQMAVSGDAARALGALARHRWWCATDQELREPSRNAAPLWPEELAVDIEDVRVAIARTLPDSAVQPQVRESEQLFIDAIAAAERYIYIENQYFTSAQIANALAARLREEAGPEVVMVLPLKTDGWLAQMTMDVIRLRLLEQLAAADHGNRLRVFHPDGPGLDISPINVHAKLMIVDDDFLRIGSSNLNNRSMVLDSECDLAIESCGEARVQHAIARFQHRLLAEHLGATIEQVKAARSMHASMIAAVDALRGGPRTLKPLDLTVPEGTVETLAAPDMFDPEQPVDPAQLVRRLLPDQERAPVRKRMTLWIALVALILGLAGAWRWTPLSEWVNPTALADMISELKTGAFTPFAVLGVYVLATLIMIPVTLLITATVLSFGSGYGFLYAVSGALLSAVVTYGLGRMIGRARVRRLAGARLNRISRQLAKRGVITIFIVRMLPVAPFTLVNLVAGASQVGLRDYVLGTLLGMTPGIIAIALLVDQINAVLHTPSWQSVLTLVAVAAVTIFAVLQLAKWLQRAAARRESQAPAAACAKNDGRKGKAQQRSESHVAAAHASARPVAGRR